MAGSASTCPASPSDDRGGAAGIPARQPSIAAADFQDVQPRKRGYDFGQRGHFVKFGIFDQGHVRGCMLAHATDVADEPSLVEERQLRRRRRAAAAAAAATGCRLTAMPTPKPAAAPMIGEMRPRMRPIANRRPRDCRILLHACGLREMKATEMNTSGASARARVTNPPSMSNPEPSSEAAKAAA